jgi:hypothetical protein
MPSVAVWTGNLGRSAEAGGSRVAGAELHAITAVISNTMAQAANM